jgi:ABC-2 type transport system ATP-binding protein
LHAIEFEAVSKRFGETQSLDGLTLSVDRGGLFGFLGPNGAGKTTTLRVMLGLVRADTGRANVLGFDPRSHADEIRRLTGALLESDGLYDRLSAEENLEYHARIRRLPPALRRERINELLTTFGLTARREEPVERWSRGMRQKLAIARALLHRPQLLLLDEPFAGLDPAAAVELRESLAQLVIETGTTLFLTSHDLGHVEKICTTVAVLQSGRILAIGPPTELLGRESVITVDITGAGITQELLATMKRDGLLVSYALHDAAARVTCTPEARPRLATELVRRGVELHELHNHRSSLEEAFLSLVAPKEGR